MSSKEENLARTIKSLFDRNNEKQGEKKVKEL